MDTTLYHPGQPVPRSGLYVVIDPQGNRTQFTEPLVYGEPFPPRVGHGYTYLLSVPANHSY